LQSLRNPSFRVLFASFSFFFLGVVINSSLSLHYLTYYVKITASSVLSTFQLTFFAGGLLGVAFWLRVSRVVEKHRLYFLASLAISGLMLGALLLLGDGRLFGTGNVRALIIGHGLVGFFASILWFIPGSMVADVADEDELATGQRREGSFFGILSFGEQLATGLSVLLAGVLADWFAGLVPAQAHQSALTINRIAVLYSVLPATLVLAAAALILRYTLTRRTVLSIQAELARRRQQPP
jgi:GPH family glycoside/pentoside/hexuronide:cation symporter